MLTIARDTFTPPCVMFIIRYLRFGSNYLLRRSLQNDSYLSLQLDIEMKKPSLYYM